MQNDRGMFHKWYFGGAWLQPRRLEPPMMRLQPLRAKSDRSDIPFMKTAIQLQFPP
jgi:hypothetical protein